jgi:hypoxanthine phosphoribosyltransferase
MGHNGFNRIVYSEEDIKKRILELGKQITADYAGKDLILVGVLKGSLFFDRSRRAIGCL